MRRKNVLPIEWFGFGDRVSKKRTRFNILLSKQHGERKRKKESERANAEGKHTKLCRESILVSKK